MYGYGITHLDEYKRSKNILIVYAFQLDGVFVKRRICVCISLRFPVWAFFDSHIIHHLDTPPLYALGG